MEGRTKGKVCTLWKGNLMTPIKAEQVGLHEVLSHADLSDMDATVHDARYYTEAEVDTLLSDGTIDHGNLSGLGDDDHTQYLLASGGRALAGAWDMGNQILTNVNMDSGDIATAVVNTEWDAAYSHISADGSSHTYIDQSVIIGASPTFEGANFTGVPDGGLSSSYLLADGTRALTGDWAWGANNISGTGDFTTTGQVYIDHDTSGVVTENLIEAEGKLESTTQNTTMNFFMADMDNGSSYPSAGTQTKVGYAVDNSLRHNQTGGTYDHYGGYFHMGSIAELPASALAVDHFITGLELKRSFINVGSGGGGSWNDVTAIGLKLTGWKHASDLFDGIAGTFTRYAIYSDGGDVELADGSISTTGTLGAGAITGTSLTDGIATLTGGSLTSFKAGSLTTNGFVRTSGGDGTLSVDTTPYIEDTTDIIKDTHIDWGTGATQVSAVDIPIADSGSIITGTEVETALQENRTAIDLNTTHRGSDGSDHSFINQDVTTTGTPTFAATLLTDKIKFTQADGNEYIDSLNDGYMDYGATTGHRFNVGGGMVASIDSGGNVYATGSHQSPLFQLFEVSSDPSEPSEGESVLWMSDGTGYGDDGDVCIASQAGGVTHKAILFDHSAGAAW